MVIEHSFVTTLDAEKALSQAATFLQARGFAALRQNGFAIDQATWNHLEMTRGKAGAADPRKCLQSIRMEFDRGRIDLAASISFTANQRAFRLSFWSSAYSEPKPTSRRGRPYAALMVAAAQALDDLLAKNISEAQASIAWMQKEADLVRQVKRQQRRSVIFTILLFAILFGVVFLAVYSTRH